MAMAASARWMTDPRHHRYTEARHRGRNEPEDSTRRRELCSQLRQQLTQPEVCHRRSPTSLVNGASGIAVSAGHQHGATASSRVVGAAAPHLASGCLPHDLAYVGWFTGPTLLPTGGISSASLRRHPAMPTRTTGRAAAFRTRRLGIGREHHRARKAGLIITELPSTMRWARRRRVIRDQRDERQLKLNGISDVADPSLPRAIEAVPAARGPASSRFSPVRCSSSSTSSYHPSSRIPSACQTMSPLSMVGRSLWA
jgi:hypothetical protein